MSTDGAAAFLTAVSAAVRDAAGVPITRGTFTFDGGGTPEQYLTLPAQPIVSVDAAAIDGVSVTDYKLIDGRLWRRLGWSHSCEPSVITVTQTCGLETVPADIVDLVCSLVGLAMANAEDGGYSSRGDLTQLRIDDYSEGYNSSASGRLAGVIELPDATRNRLRARFGSAAGFVGFR
ncbi:hypothetical protein ACFORO_42495 [Amycolatopsis halotolerans]|uniref:Head-to-tail adaptor n=2 Tax=Amycolatopsis halotolerans TaxID=330083 RepID=A0ABV7QUA8_9PSEU